MMKLRNVLSLFDEMSCGRVALERAEISYQRYYAAEIDKFAMEVSQKNYPDTIQLGDVTKWREWDIDWSSIDLLIGGSPCQGFSFAGKQLNFNDPRSMLFFEYVNILDHIKKVNPKVKFLLENVVMKQEFQNIISGYLNVAPVQINSALVSAQNRERLYWTNIADILQPKDIGICLKDILQPEHEVDEKYYLSEEQISKIDFSNVEKRYFSKERNVNQIDNIVSSGNWDNPQRGRIYSPYGKSPSLNCCGGGGLEPKVLIKIDKQGNLKNNQSKASCLTGGGNSGGNHSDMDLIAICIAQRGRNIVDGKRKDIKGAKTKQRFEARADEKTNCLTSVQKDDLLLVKEATKQGYCEIAPGECVDLTQPKSKTRRGRRMVEKSNCMTAGNFEFCYYDGYRIRRLTPVECERLQTLIDGYTSGVSDSQRYKMLGNGWTVDVIVWILSHLKNLDNSLKEFGFAERPFQTDMFGFDFRRVI